MRKKITHQRMPVNRKVDKADNQEECNRGENEKPIVNIGIQKNCFGFDFIQVQGDCVAVRQCEWEVLRL